MSYNVTWVNVIPSQWQSEWHVAKHVAYIKVFTVIKLDLYGNHSKCLLAEGFEYADMVCWANQMIEPDINIMIWNMTFTCNMAGRHAINEILKFTVSGMNAWLKQTLSIKLWATVLCSITSFWWMCYEILIHLVSDVVINIRCITWSWDIRIDALYPCSWLVTCFMQDLWDIYAPQDLRNQLWVLLISNDLYLQWKQINWVLELYKMSLQYEFYL